MNTSRRIKGIRDRIKLLQWGEMKWYWQGEETTRRLSQQGEEK